MSVDVLVLLRGASAEAYCAEHPEPVRPLDDGVLAWFPVRYEEMKADPRQAAYFLHHALGEAAVAAHDDPRGVLLLPDSWEPRSESYAKVAAEAGAHGLWVKLLTREERAAFEEERLKALPAQLKELERLKGLLAELAAAEQRGDAQEVSRVEARLPASLREQRERIRSETAAKKP